MIFGSRGGNGVSSRLRNSILAMVAAVCASSCSERPNAQAASGRQQAAVRGPLCLVLDPPRRSIKLAEPITLVASLVNCSTSAQQVQDLLDPDLGFLQVWVRPPGAAEIRSLPVTRREGRGRPTRTLAPGERLTAFVPIYFGSAGWTMKSPGDYRVRAEYAVDTLTVPSNVVQIIVEASSRRADGRAADLFLTPQVGLFLLTGQDADGTGTRTMQGVVSQLGDSSLASYAHIALGMAASRSRFDPATKTFRAAGCERAASHFAQAIPNVSDAVIAAAGTARWISCLQQLERGREADRALAVFYQAHPSARTLPGVEQIVALPARRN